MSARPLFRVLPGVETADGAGVRLRRSIGSVRGVDLDPFLLLDEFSSDDPDDYIAGFPSHPHRGFETVTYMLDGRMLHEDHLGHHSVIGPGDVQWMTAGRGIIHSEMPQQDRGRMRGFQLWLNLPAAEKMKPADYRDIPAAEIPVLDDGDGAIVRLIAGTLPGPDGRTVSAPVNGNRDRGTDPLVFDISLDAGAERSIAVPAGHRVAVYVFEGAMIFGDRGVDAHAAAILGDGDSLRLRAGAEGARGLVLAGRPLREPVVQYGPFVMNTREEIEQAMRDYGNGGLTG